MLTWADLEAKCGANLLVRRSYRGTQPGDGRSLYVLPEVNTALDNRPWPGSEADATPAHTRERRGAMLSLLERYIRGAAIRHNVDLKDLTFGSGATELKGYFEFRSLGRMHETRLFGFFARPGAFVGTDFKSRGEFGDIKDPAWLAQRNACEGKWKALFGDVRYMASPWPVLNRARRDAYLERKDD